jgi:predicted DNA-binding transcriptional regulator YafY
MSNSSNPELWAARERLRFIECSAWWRGVVGRQDVAAVFGVSMAQVSADLQKYQEMNPTALIYNLRRKRYEGRPEMVPVVHKPTIEEAVTLFLRGGELAGQVASLGKSGEGFVEEAAVDAVPMPERRISGPVMRRVFLAVVWGQRVKVRYYSVRGAEDAWRWIQPHAFAHNGLRWHVRAWCETSAEHRDFVLGRCAGAEWPVEVSAPPPRDAAWAERTVIELCPHRDLDAAQRRAIELEYGMQGGVLRLEVRRAMGNYVRERLGLPLWDGQPAKPRLEIRDKR